MENKKRKVLIDRTELLMDLNHFAPEHFSALVNMLIMKQPTVDAVEVVRCKDCDWFRDHEGTICVNPKCVKSWYGCPVPADHFCSYGERRTDG